jgi:hypothetical protein
LVEDRDRGVGPRSDVVLGPAIRRRIGIIEDRQRRGSGVPPSFQITSPVVPSM